MDKQVLWLVSGMCALTLTGVFWKMKPGFGPNNLQAVGIVLIAFLASVLSILRPDGLNAAMGILGAVGGYLFGMRSNPPDVKPFVQPPQLRIRLPAMARNPIAIRSRWLVAPPPRLRLQPPTSQR